MLDYILAWYWIALYFGGVIGGGIGGACAFFGCA